MGISVLLRKKEPVYSRICWIINLKGECPRVVFIILDHRPFNSLKKIRGQHKKSSHVYYFQSLTFGLRCRASPEIKRKEKKRKEILKVGITWCGSQVVVFV